MSVNQLRDAAVDISGRANLFKFEPPQFSNKRIQLRGRSSIPSAFRPRSPPLQAPALLGSCVALQPLANVGNPPAPGRAPSS